MEEGGRSGGRIVVEPPGGVTCCWMPFITVFRTYAEYHGYVLLLVLTTQVPVPVPPVVGLYMMARPRGDPGIIRRIPGIPSFFFFLSSSSYFSSAVPHHHPYAGSGVSIATLQLQLLLLHE